MAWIFLLLAGVLEVVWASFMKQSNGFTKAGPTAVTLIAMTASFVLLAFAMKTIPLATAYTVWTGIGAVGAFIVGVWILGEIASPMRILSAVLILTGVVLMKVASRL
jgi:quaternary ammonium compound-resistance protein SugE